MYGLNQSILGHRPFVFNDGLLIAKSFGDWRWNPQKKRPFRVAFKLIYNCLSINKNKNRLCCKFVSDQCG